ncbi:hypothetical protein INR49_015882 [Caranx melampygus]|nr:hypothetical protein INR49_015882 [Caranx melampygus]
MECYSSFLSIVYHEDEGVIYVEKFGVPQLLSAEDAGVEGISLHIQLQSRCVEDVGEVQVLLSRDVGEVSLGFVHGLSQAEFSQMFLEKTQKDIFSPCSIQFTFQISVL